MGATSMATAAAAAAATAEWLELFDPQTGRVVYANIVTGKCSWTRPTAEIAARDPRGEWWELADDETGVPYYYNSTTGATEWDAPTDATVVPIHALLASSMGKRLSLAVSNRGSVAFIGDSGDTLSRKASRASMYSGRCSTSAEDGGRSPALNSTPPELPAADRRVVSPAIVPSAVHEQVVSTGEDEQVVSPTIEDSSELPAAKERPAKSKQRHSHSESALEELRAVSRRESSVDPRCMDPELEASREVLQELKEDPQTERARQNSESFLSPTSGSFMSEPGRMSAADWLPRRGTASSIMLHAQRNRSMPAIGGGACGMRVFAATQFAAHKRGILRRKVPLDELVSYAAEVPTRPLLSLPRDAARDAQRSFGVVQRAMDGGDAGDDVLWLANAGIRTPALRDEILCQVAKQVTGNPSNTAASRGWALAAALLYAFRPSSLLLPHFEAFVATAPDPSLRCLLQLQLVRARRTAARTASISARELRLALTAASRPPIFGAPLAEIAASPSLMDARSGLPRILPALATLVMRLGGDRTEGLFRVPADADDVAMARLRIDAGLLDLSHVRDPSVPASLLKEWLRDLPDPVIPAALYSRCRREPTNVINMLPDFECHILRFLLSFLSRLLHPAVQSRTKMSAHSLALVFAPALLRNPSADLKDAFASSAAEHDFVLALFESTTAS
ncbi:hypothetical protein GGF46_000444 [Coemansia sp. RSA 552]|nr:hypothetical protein GGF46_000444 [Coemansia sp. RSA 552]